MNGDLQKKPRPTGNAPLACIPADGMHRIARGDAAAIRAHIEALETDTFVFIADFNTWRRYGEPLRPRRGRVTGWLSPPGEDGKTFENYRRCAEHLLSEGVHRGAHVIALGGGAVSDLAGFVAATLLRGLPWTVVPTTLLAMVDAAIGGKTGINTAQGKNLVGAFHFPESVWLNASYLESLPQVEILSGKGEILKYAFLDKGIHDLVSRSAPQCDVIAACAEYKREIVRRDPKETGLRQILNLGHTYGHALEKAFRLPHGIAVAAGIRFVFEHLENKSPLIREYGALLARLGLDPAAHLPQKPWTPSRIRALVAFVGKDKKMKTRGDLDLVLPTAIGSPEVRRTPLAEIARVFEALGGHRGAGREMSP